MIEQSKEETKRREYRAPTLISYGDIVDVTRNVGAHGNADGASSGPKNSIL